MHAGWKRGAIVAMALVLTGCKLDVVASVKGYKPGTSSTMLVHVKSKPGAFFTCSPSCYPCASFTLPQSGEVDIEIDLNAEAPSKQVCLYGKAGLFEGNVTLPISGPGGLPPTLTALDNGLVSCNVKKCLGGVDLLPAPSFHINSEPGAIVEVAGKRFTTDEHGDGSTPIDVALAPPLKDLSLVKLCGKDSARLGAIPVALTFRDGAKVSTQLPITSAAVARSLDTALGAVDKGPALFPWEKGGVAPPKGKRAALVLRSDCTAGGPPTATLSDAAIIVKTTSLTRAGTCEYDTIATNTKTGAQQNRGKSSGKLTFHDLAATAYDRFSGKVVGTRTFEAPKHCAEKQGATISEQSSYASESAIATWASAL